MYTLFDNVFYKKRNHPILDEVINITYWLILMTKNVCKLMSAFWILNKYPLKYILILWPIFRFCFIGIGNLKSFKTKFRRLPFIIIMSFLILIESVYELPMNYFFPKNTIYMYTNYYNIYDIGKKKTFQIIFELSENLLIIIFCIFAFINNDIGIVIFLTLSFSIAIFCYYLLATFYFLFIYKKNDEEENLKKNFEKKKALKASIDNEMMYSLKKYPHILKSYKTEEDKNNSISDNI